MNACFRPRSGRSGGGDGQGRRCSLGEERRQRRGRVWKCCDRGSDLPLQGRGRALLQGGGVVSEGYYFDLFCFLKMKLLTETLV